MLSIVTEDIPNHAEINLIIQIMQRVTYRFLYTVEEVTRIFEEHGDVIATVNHYLDIEPGMIHLKLMNTDRGLFDFDVVSPAVLRRVCIDDTPKCKSIIMFNVYHGESSKTGVDFKGDIIGSILAVRDKFGI
jgi:hypothetical protein